MLTLVVFTIGFSVACALLGYFYVDWLWIMSFGTLFVSVLLYLLAKGRIWIRAIATVLLGCAIGSGWGQLYSGVYLAPASKLDMQESNVTITVTDYCYETDYGVASEGLLYLDNKPYFVKFYLNDNVSLEPGSSVSGNFRFRLTTGTGVNDPTYHRSEGKFLLLYAKGDVVVRNNDSAPWYCKPAVWRNRLLTGIHEMFPEDTAGFVQALFLGDRSNLDYETQTALKESGVQHVVAVSGLHVSILFGLLEVLTFRKRFLNLFISVPVLILFAAVVGFSPSVTRACVMQILMVVAEVAFEDYDPPSALAFSVLIMLVVNPLAITSVSLQLSAGCVIGIILFYERIKAWIQSRKWYGSAEGKGIVPKMKRWFSASVSVTLCAMIITTPLVAVYFGMVSLVGVITNLLTLWCLSFVFYGIIICCTLNAIGFGFTGFVANVISWPIRYVLMVSRLCAKMPLATVYTQSKYIIIWLIICYVLLVAFMLMKKKHTLTLFACCSCLLVVAMFLSWSEPRLYTTYATFLDVGHGQCIILQSGGHTFLVDCGGASDTKTADIAAETLLSRGISRVDGILLTHYDRDHAGGLPYLLTRIQADNIYLPYIADKAGYGAQVSELSGANVISIRKDLDILFSDGKLRIFSSDSYSLGNESGICVLFQTKNCDILITGDKGELGEMLLLNQHTLPEIDVLVAGHHGSAGSTSQRLLMQTKPKMVVISVGDNNPYGHPAEALLDRLEAAGCEIFRTDLDGTIIYRR